MAHQAELLRSFKRLALRVAIIIAGAPALAYVWYALLWVIGQATGSGALGICGPYGPWGGFLFLALLAGLIATVPATFVLARRVVDRLLPDLLTFEPSSPHDHTPQ